MDMRSCGLFFFFFFFFLHKENETTSSGSSFQPKLKFYWNKIYMFYDIAFKNLDQVHINWHTIWWCAQFCYFSTERISWANYTNLLPHHESASDEKYNFNIWLQGHCVLNNENAFLVKCFRIFCLYKETIFIALLPPMNDSGVKGCNLSFSCSILKGCHSYLYTCSPNIWVHNT